MKDPEVATNPRLLIVEDERAQRLALCSYLRKRGFEVDEATSGEEALELLVSRSFSLMITDLRLPQMEGLELVRRAHEIDEELPVLLVTAYASVQSVIEALRIGAHDYLLKPLILEEVRRKVTNLLDQRAIVRENTQLRRALSRHADERELIAQSTAMDHVREWVTRAASMRSNVLITGETGTGKEVVARAIHNRSAEPDRPFLAINLAALPETMVESELFGHERGAFTNADHRREGILRAAGNGTVLLDEIGELPMSVQAKLLRAMEAREVQPLGSDRTAPFEARLVCATHRDLKDMVADGRFREDLFYRLNVLHIPLPPLRKRREDIPVLTRVLLRRHAQNSGLTVPILSGEAMRVLCDHRWQGNVRELSNVLERALILADDGRIDVGQLPEDIRGVHPAQLNLQDAVASFEREHIAQVLRSCAGNRDKAADALGVSPATLYRRLERLDLKGFEVHRRAPADAHAQSHN